MVFMKALVPPAVPGLARQKQSTRPQAWACAGPRRWGRAAWAGAARGPPRHVSSWSSPGGLGRDIFIEKKAKKQEL